MSGELEVFDGAHCRCKNDGAGTSDQVNSQTSDASRLAVPLPESDQPQNQTDGNAKEHEAAITLERQNLAPADEKDDSTLRGRYSHLIQTTDSLVTAILEGIKDVGSNLPGIGAIAVVLSLKDKIQVRHDIIQCLLKC